MLKIKEQTRLLETSLRTANSLKKLEQTLEHYLNNFGISNFAFTYYSFYPNSLNKLKYDFSSASYAPWHQHYIAEHYEDVDSTLENVYQMTLPLFWDVRQQLREAKSPRERKMREDSLAFGVEKGFLIPIHGPLEDFACLVVSQTREQNWCEEIIGLEYELFLAAYYFYSYLQKQLLKAQTPNAKHQLNKREIQCLTLLAKQYSVEAIAKSLNITERTVNHYMQCLNKKLGTQNKYQSVIKALNKGLIKI